MPAMRGKIADTKYRVARIDASTGSLMMVSYEHHEAHSGSAYLVTNNAAGGDGTKSTVTFATPDTTKWIHVIATARSNVEALFTVGEAATISAPSGINYQPRNKNRNSTKTSGLLPAGSTGLVGNVTTGATVTSFGTVLEEIHFGSGVKSGGSERGQNEWVLRQNTTYAFEVQSQAATSEVSIDLHWYEHTDRD